MGQPTRTELCQTKAIWNDKSANSRRRMRGYGRCPSVESPSLRCVRKNTKAMPSLFSSARRGGRSRWESRSSPRFAPAGTRSRSSSNGILIPQRRNPGSRLVLATKGSDVADAQGTQRAPQADIPHRAGQSGAGLLRDRRQAPADGGAHGALAERESRAGHPGTHRASAASPPEALTRPAPLLPHAARLMPHALRATPPLASGLCLLASGLCTGAARSNARIHQ